jgi:hypothetical protein
VIVRLDTEVTGLAQRLHRTICFLIKIITGTILGITAAAVVLAVTVGLLLWYWSVSSPSATTYAQKHVQALFVDSAGRDTARVTGCREIAQGLGAGEKLWSCRVSNRHCARRLKFAVDHDYGTTAYDSVAANAEDNLCAAG